MIKKMLFMIFMVFLINDIFADESQNFSVMIEVTCDNTNTRDVFKSYLSRELRSLGDVTINGDVPMFGIWVTIIELTGNTAVAVSTIIEGAYPREYLSQEFDEKDREKFIQVTSGVSYLIDSYLNTGSKDRLRYISETIINRFDTTVLEKYRR